MPRGTDPLLGELDAGLPAMTERLIELEKALRFYASRTNHRGVGVSNVYNDGGRKAREVLGPCGNCEGYGQVKTGRRIMDQDGPYDEYGTCPACWGAGIPRA